MSFVVVKLPDEPIIIVHVQLPLEQHLYAARAAWLELNQQAEKYGAPFYGIVDLSHTQPDFSDILIWLDERRSVPTGRIKSPHLQTIAVGMHPMIELGVRKTRRLLGSNTQVFSTIPEALYHVRTEIAATQAVVT